MRIRSTGKPEWATVAVACSALSRISCRWPALRLTARTSARDVTKDQVKDAPGVESDGELSEAGGAPAV